MSNKKAVFSNFIWRFAERCGAQGVTFIVSIFLARLLEPEVYGQVAIITVFINVLQVFIDGGFGNALIQKKNADNIDFSSVFYFNIICCMVMYILMFSVAPYISSFYAIPELTQYVRVLSLLLIISGVKNIQQAYISKNLQFKKFFFATLGGTIGAGILGIFMAYAGLGIWALIAQQLFNAVADTIILWITVKWRPQNTFSLERLRGLYSYGWKLFVSHFLDTFYKNIRLLLIGKFYSSEDLAYYNRGEQFPKMLVSNINSSLDSVLFPVMSTAQGDVAIVKQMTRRSIQISSYLIFPAMVGLAVCSEPIICILLTEKWLFAVPYLQIFCFVYAFRLIHTANLNAIKALGRSDIFMKLEIMKKSIDLFFICITLQFGPLAIAISGGVLAPIASVINAYPNKRLLEYSYLEQLKDIAANILLAIIMGGGVYLAGFLNFTTGITLMIQILVGIIVYLLLSHFSNNCSYKYILEMLKSLKNKNG